jgi:hypothetical protein
VVDAQGFRRFNRFRKSPCFIVACSPLLTTDLKSFWFSYSYQANHSTLCIYSIPLSIMHMVRKYPCYHERIGMAFTPVPQLGNGLPSFLWRFLECFCPPRWTTLSSPSCTVQVFGRCGGCSTPAVAEYRLRDCCESAFSSSRGVSIATCCGLFLCRRKFG